MIYTFYLPGLSSYKNMYECMRQLLQPPAPLLLLLLRMPPTLLHCFSFPRRWKTFQADRTPLFDRIIAAMGSQVGGGSLLCLTGLVVAASRVQLTCLTGLPGGLAAVGFGAGRRAGRRAVVHRGMGGHDVGWRDECCTARSSSLAHASCSFRACAPAACLPVLRAPLPLGRAACPLTHASSMQHGLTHRYVYKKINCSHLPGAPRRWSCTRRTTAAWPTG